MATTEACQSSLEKKIRLDKTYPGRTRKWSRLEGRPSASPQKLGKLICYSEKVSAPSQNNVTWAQQRQSFFSLLLSNKCSPLICVFSLHSNQAGLAVAQGRPHKLQRTKLKYGIESLDNDLISGLDEDKIGLFAQQDGWWWDTENPGNSFYFASDATNKYYYTTISLMWVSEMLSLRLHERTWVSPERVKIKMCVFSL